jgi:hypothetical protein
MTITLGNTLKGLLGGGGPLTDQLFGSAGNDPTLNSALPAEANIREKLWFSNIRIKFPTTAGSMPYLNSFGGQSLSFPAYISAFSDTFSPFFSQVSVYGRTDSIPVYSKTSRSISVSLVIPCFDANDANENMKKINQFIKNLYPSYKSFKGDLVLSSPPLVRVRFANLILNHEFGNGLLGYIKSFSWNFTPSDGFYFGKDKNNTSNLFFRSYTLSFSFDVLHESVIGFKDGAFNSSNQNYPYRTATDIQNPIQSGKIQSNPAISKDVNEAKLLGGG